MALLVILGAAASDRRARAGSKYPKLAAYREALKEPLPAIATMVATPGVAMIPVVAAGVC